MKIVKRLLLVLLVLIVLLLGSAIALPFLFQDKLIELAKEEANRTVNAVVDFEDVSLSLFRSFPNFSFRLEDYSVIGKDTFEGIPLAKGKAIDFTLDLMSVVSTTRPVSIKAVRLEQPDIHILVLKDGTANYDITIPTEEVAAEAASDADYSQVVVELDAYSISDGKLIYDDRSIGTYVEASQVQHQGSGNFTIDVYDLGTKTEAEAITVRQDGITYLKKAHATLDAILNIDQKNGTYTLKENKLLINELNLRADGFVQLAEDDINMDLSFNTPQNDFKNLLSMIPNAYIEGYEEVKADGQFTLSGQVKGTYNGEREEYPGFRLEVSVSDGNVQYPGLPLGIGNIHTRALINSPGSDFDDMTVDVPRFSMKIGQNPMDAKFFLKTPISDPDVKAEANGAINLKELAQAFPMEGIQELNGIIRTDLKVDTRLSYIEQEAYERVNMSGKLQVEQMNYRSEGLPAIKINNMAMDFTPQNVRISQFDGQLGKSDISATGAIDNILAYFSPEKTMKGNIRVRSDYFNADEWIPESASSEAVPVAASGSTTEEAAIFDRFDFALDAEARQIDYTPYKITNGVARGNITPDRLEVSQFSALIGDSDFSATGVFTNLFGYLFENGTLGGNINLQSQRLNLNQFMEEEGEASGGEAGGEAYGTIPVPPNIDMTANASIGSVLYTNMELKDVNGMVHIADEEVVVEKATGRTLGGNIDMSGSYNTQDIDNPAFNFKFGLQSLQFQQAFNTLNTFQQLAPIGKYIQGSFNSTMIMSGILGTDMMPRLESLNAEGFLETINGVIRGFKPAQAIGNTLNIKYLKQDISITNTRNWFEVKDGTLELKEYDARIQDINMRIGGTYSLANAMNLNIKALIPRELLEQNALGAAASSGLDLLSQQASKMGINIQQGENINVLINLGGQIEAPKVGVKLLGMDGESSLAGSVKEQAGQEVKRQLEEGKQAAKLAAEKAVDSAKATARTEVERAAEKATEEAKKAAEKAAKEAIGGALDTAAQKKVDEILEGAGKEGACEIKDHLDQFNPFKKKKKDGN